MSSDMLTRMIEDSRSRRAADAQRYADADTNLCMLCHAYGTDKRSLFIACFYAIHEVVPEAIDLSDVPAFTEVNANYYLRICKACRGALLGMLGEWRNDRITRRGRPKDHDGNDVWDYEDHARNIPVRINGTTVMMDEREYAEFQSKRPASPEGSKE